MYEKTRAPIWLEKIPVNSPHQSVRNIATNVRLISGKKDDITPADYSVRFHQLLKNAGVVTTLNILPNLGHDILLEDQAIQDLLEFIQLRYRNSYISRIRSKCRGLVYPVKKPHNSEVFGPFQFFRIISNISGSNPRSGHGISKKCKF